MVDSLDDPGAMAPKPATAPAHVAPPPDAEPKHPTFPIILGAALIMAIVIACTSNPQPVAASAAAAAAPTPPPTPAVDHTSDIKALRTDLDALASRIDEIRDDVAGLPKVDLKPIESKIEAAAKSAAASAALAKRVSEIDGRLGAIDKSIATLRDELAALKDEVKKAPPPAASTPEPAKPEKEKLAGEDFEEATKLFQAGKFKEANEAFHKLTETYPEDARVWYYAALSNGLATNQWQGETLRLVNKGVERERAGTPDPAKIDMGFATLAPPTARTWLDYYRKTAQR